MASHEASGCVNRVVRCTDGSLKDPIHRGDCFVARVTLMTAFALACVVTPRATATAQSTEVITSGELSVLPDAFSSLCGRSLLGMPGVGMQGALRRTWHGWLLADVGSRLVLKSVAGGCTDDLPIVLFPDGTYETRPGYDYPGAPRTPFFASAMRVGAAYQWRAVQLSALGGAGITWGASNVPITLGALGLRFGRGARALHLELERANAWVEGAETRERYREGSGSSTFLGSYVDRRTRRSPWWSMRMGVGIRLARWSAE